MPDPVVAPEAVRTLFGPGGCCARLTAPQRAVHQAILRGFAATGQPPPAAELEPAAARSSASAAQVLHELAASELIGVDAAGRVLVAYPFSAVTRRCCVAVTRHPTVKER